MVSALLRHRSALGQSAKTTLPSDTMNQSTWELVRLLKASVLQCACSCVMCLYSYACMPQAAAWEERGHAADTTPPQSACICTSLHVQKSPATPKLKKLQMEPSPGMTQVTSYFSKVGRQAVYTSPMSTTQDVQSGVFAA
eukprot:353268-Chlamydomonas_euryale.AAC.7